MVWRVNSEDVLDGKVAVVTGTSRGVGVGIPHELLRAGATVIGCSRSKLDTIPGARQPAVVRHPRVPADARPRRRGSIINISSGAGHPADAGFLRCCQGGPQPPHPLTGRGMGPACARQRLGAGPDDDRQLPVVRAAQGRPEGRELLSIDGGMLPGVLYEAGLKTITDLL